MNKSKSVPAKLCSETYTLRTSSSLENLDEIKNDFICEEIIEGDGPFGIEFYEDKGHNIIIKNIIKNTAFDEYYKLKKNLILIEINDTPIGCESYSNIMININTIWNKNSKIKLRFKKHIIPELSMLLNKYDLYKYYDNFIDLGAKCIEDFDYVIHSDLINMNMSQKDIINFKKINSDI
jgi:hypothetical protein